MKYYVTTDKMKKKIIKIVSNVSFFNCLFKIFGSFIGKKNSKRIKNKIKKNLCVTV